MEQMIAVSVRKDEIKVYGHANHAAKGHDIVCAGATALVQNLIKSIEDLTEDKIEYDISPGRADIKYGNLSEKAKTLVDSFFVGICMIANEFPDYVKIV
ncbi:MAG: ribosomal-processing cysteine protease Prp [Blautia sp.]|uniref:ribosomal-processing cysteine protease Prp n=1 Tax=Blautia sp. TaxID=1955243 RepID=UPI002E771F90|nr:ribosomal-processing cysteine protease Prp [Blautia sp.]MEE1444517.1 ribosomal-processing cysteine protease Prp [Blautia sp.]